MEINKNESELHLYPTSNNELLGSIYVKGTKLPNSIQTVVLLDCSGSMQKESARFVREILPLVMSKLITNKGLDLITFATKASWKYLTLTELMSANIVADGSTNMAPAIRILRLCLESIHKNYANQPVRVLSISNGMIGDREAAEKETKKLIDFLATTGMTINSQAVRLFTSQTEPDTRALCYLLQINNTSTSTSNLCDIKAKENNEMIARAIAALFQSDGFGNCQTFQVEKPLILKYPWNSEGSRLTLLSPGWNILWLKLPPTGVVKLGKDHVKVIVERQLSLTKFHQIMETKLIYICDRLAILKIVDTVDANRAVGEICAYFETTEDALANKSSSANTKIISNLLYRIAKDKTKFDGCAQMAEFLRNTKKETEMHIRREREAPERNQREEEERRLKLEEEERLRDIRKEEREEIKRERFRREEQLKELERQQNEADRIRREDEARFNQEEQERARQKEEKERAKREEERVKLEEHERVKLEEEERLRVIREEEREEIKRERFRREEQLKELERQQKESDRIRPEEQERARQKEKEERAKREEERLKQVEPEREIKSREAELDRIKREVEDRVKREVEERMRLDAEEKARQTLKMEEEKLRMQKNLEAGLLVEPGTKEKLKILDPSTGVQHINEKQEVISENVFVQKRTAMGNFESFAKRPHESRNKSSLITTAAKKVRKLTGACISSRNSDDFTPKPIQTVFILHENVSMPKSEKKSWRFAEKIVPLVFSKISNGNSQLVDLITVVTDETPVVQMLQSILQTLDANKPIRILILTNVNAREWHSFDNFADKLIKFLNGSNFSFELQVIRIAPESLVNKLGINKYQLLDIDSRKSNAFIAIQIVDLFHSDGFRKHEQKTHRMISGETKTDMESFDVDSKQPEKVRSSNCEFCHANNQKHRRSYYFIYLIIFAIPITLLLFDILIYYLKK